MPIASLILVAFLFLAHLEGSIEIVGRSAQYSQFAHVRPIDPTCTSLVQRGTDRSATFRHLVSSIEASDIIVYVECGQRLRTGVVGVTRLSARAGGFRYVRVSIDQRVAGDDAVAILGHELYHVTELAAARHVIDASTMRELYMTLGQETCAEEPPCFDTPEA